MNLSNIKEQFKKHEISLINVLEFDETEGKTMIFDGDLSEYIESLSALNIKAVFLNVGILPDSIFMMNVGEEIDDYDLMSEEIDLSKINKNISKYKKYIEEIAYFHFVGISQYGNLEFRLQEKWMDELFELIELARIEASGKYINEIEDKQIKEVLRQNELLKLIHSLKDNKQFSKCKTQKIKTVFALEMYPELKELDSSALKIAIQDVSAQVEVKLIKEPNK